MRHKANYFFILFIFLECRSAPVTLHDNTLEPVYEKILRDSAIKKRLAEIDVSANQFTIEELFVLSLDRTERMAITAEKGFAAEAQLRKSYGAWLPRLSVSAAQYAPATPGFVVPGVRFTARQNIMTGLTEYTGIVGARLQRVAEEQGMRAELAAHLLNIADATLQLKLSEELARQTAEVVTATQANFAEIRRRVGIGRNKRGDLLKAEARLKQKQADLLAAQERQAQLTRYLQFITGVGGKFSVNTDTTIFSRATNEKDDADLSQRADIALGKTVVAIRKNEVDTADGGHMPNIYLDGSYRPAIDGTQQQSYFGGVVAEVPFFQGGQVVENQNIARSRLRQAELELKQAERKARTELEDAREAFLKASAERTAYEESANAAERNYNAQLADLRLSLATILDVVQAMEDLQAARTSRATAEYKEGIARVRYFVSLGLLFPEKH